MNNINQLYLELLVQIAQIKKNKIKVRQVNLKKQKLLTKKGEMDEKVFSIKKILS